MVPELWSVNRLACELAMDRRALGRNLSGLAPKEEKTTAGGKRVERLYLLADVIQHLSAPGSESLDLNQERARLAVLQQEKLRYEIGELQGAMVRMSVIEPHWASMVASMRARLLALPSRIAGAIATPDKLPEVQALIQTQIHEALEEISGSAVPEEVERRIERHTAGDSGTQPSTERSIRKSTTPRKRAP